MKRNSKVFGGQFGGVSADERQFRRAASDLIGGAVCVDSLEKLPARFTFPELDPNASNYESLRDRRLCDLFAALKRTLVPNPKPLSDLAKRVLETPIGMAPK